MVLGIEEAYNRGIRNLLVEGDSMLIINQLKGKWQIKNKDLKDLHLSIALILKSFNSIIYNHIYRNFNSRADELANLSLQKENRFL
jgi:ribonuclease HI